MAKIINLNLKATTAKEDIIWQSNDDPLTLYSRKGSKKKIIWYRLVLFGTGFKERKSTGTSNKYEAIAIAQARYDQLKYRKSKGHSLKIPTFEEMSQEYFKNFQAKVKVGTKSISPYRLSDMERRFNNYLNPFFKNKTLDEIDDDSVLEFYECRKRLYRQEKKVRIGLKRQKDGSIKYKVTDKASNVTILRHYMKKRMPPLREPNGSTFQLDRNLILAVFKYALSKKRITANEMISLEKVEVVADRRGFFDKKSWKEFQDDTRRVMKERQKKFRDSNGDNYAKFYYTAAMLHYWSLLSVSIGLRPNEMKAIRYT